MTHQGSSPLPTPNPNPSTPYCNPHPSQHLDPRKWRHRALRSARSMLKQPGGLPDHLNRALSIAYDNFCDAREPIRTIDDLHHLKDLDDWVIGVMMESILESSADLSPPKSNTSSVKKGKKPRQPKRYVPQKNSADYALLITLYRETTGQKRFMFKQELIDTAEASGLSEFAIGPNKYKGKPGGISIKDRYTGWNSMTTLINKELVMKYSNPAKYKLTDEGKETARDCLSRSRLDDPAGPSVTINRPSTSVAGHSPELVCRNSATKTPRKPIHLSSQEQLSYSSNNRTTSNCSEQIVICDSDSDEPYKRANPIIGSEKSTERSSVSKFKARSSSSFNTSNGRTINFGTPNRSASVSSISPQGTFSLQSYSTMGAAEFNMLDRSAAYIERSILAMPPRRSNEKFLDAYEVVLILDDRENFGPCFKRKVVDNIHLQFDIPVQMKRLPVGDCIWIARHKELGTEYVLDFIVERKNVEDLGSSISDNRYRNQKLRLKKCGLRKVIYLVEGNPNDAEASQRIKTACFTTEILEGFDIQRTTGYSDTEKAYGRLTLSIIDYYSTNFSICANTSRVCLTYDDFTKKCRDLEKVTVSDVFALQLMQVPQVTEEIALAVLERYSTLHSLARAYSMLEGGDTRDQEEMLKNEIEMVNEVASRNIFKLVWADG